MEVPKIEIKKILYATDLSVTGRRAFTYAANLAHTYSAQLTVLHVVNEGPELDPRLEGYMTEELWEAIKNRDLAEAREMLMKRRRDDVAIKNMVGEDVTEHWHYVMATMSF